MQKTRTNRNSTARHAQRQERRGNTIVLVAGILVLLVIIATSYLTRTQSQRTVSVATMDWHGTDAAVGIIAESVAEELAMQLFVWPIDPEIYFGVCNSNPWCVMSANWPRLHPTTYSQLHARFDSKGNRVPIEPRRYNVDHSPEAAKFGRSFAFNHAPYHTAPWTNWPDPFSLAWDEGMWPAGPGNMSDKAGSAPFIAGAGKTVAQGLLASEYNPLGNPGFGDNRLLADIEPMRLVLTGGSFKGAEVFSHWRKLTNLAHANNPWRVVADISDVDRNIVHDLNIPIEQWLSRRVHGLTPNFSPNAFAAGNTMIVPGSLEPSANVLEAQFIQRWRAWFGLPDATFPQGNTYESLYVNIGPGESLWAPPNFLNLRNLNATADIHQVGDRPQDEFVYGMRRHAAARVLADTTGDGFTDAFWFETPVPTRNGIRTIAAVRIVDNNAMLNMNVAGQFQRNNGDASPLERRKTTGAYPSDLAAVGQFIAGPENPPLSPPAAIATNNYRVGLYDNVANWYGVQHYPDHTAAQSLWNRHLEATGMVLNPAEWKRREHWRLSGRLGLSEPLYLPGELPYRPFALADEVELRMFQGNNHPWIFTRFEQTTQRESGSGGGILRAAVNREESSEYLDQLTNVERVRDLRSKITLYNGARNDQMPPWLWWENRRHPNSRPAVFPSQFSVPNPLTVRLVESRLRQQLREKLDLREMIDRFYDHVDLSLGPDYLAYGPANQIQNTGRINFRDRLADTLLLVLTDSGDEMRTPLDFADQQRIFGSYYGPYVGADFDPSSTQEWDPVLGPVDVSTTPFSASEGALNKTRRMAAAFASNILAYRSNKPATLNDSVFDLPRFGLNMGNNPPNVIFGTGKLNDPPELTRTGYLPLTPQPFITEVFIGHVYKASSDAVPEGYIDPNTPGYEPGVHGCNLSAFGIEPTQPYLNPSGQYLIFDGAEDRSAIVIVQVANPFDVPIDLGEYRLEILGNATNDNRVILADVLSPTNRFLPPARDGRPSTAIFYAIRDEIGDPAEQLHEIREKWKQFTDIDITVPFNGDPTRAGELDPVLPPQTLVVNVGLNLSGSPLINVESRSPYDNSGPGRTVSISRLDTSLPTAVNPQWIVVDRIDPPTDFEYRDRVRDMERYMPRTKTEVLGGAALLCHVLPDANNYFPTYAVDSADHHWVQWVRATRAWGVDLNGNGVYEAHERNPRYVFGDRAIVVPTWHGTPEADHPDTGEQYRFSRPRRQTNAYNWDDDKDFAGANMYRFEDDPHDSPAGSGKPWFARTYYNTYGDLVDGDTPSSGRTPGVTVGSIIPARKPTFFALGWRSGQWASILSTDNRRRYFMPDKGWYGQFKIDLRGQPLAPEHFKTVGVGWGTPGPSTAGGSVQPTSGVDDPTVLFDGMAFHDGRPGGDNVLEEVWTAPDLPLFRQPYSMQMTLKNKHIPVGYTSPNLTAQQLNDAKHNRDFEQVGELLNVWLFGHEIRFTRDSNGVIDPNSSINVRATFAEHMSRARRGASTTSEHFLWTLTGGTPDFDVTLNEGTANELRPYQRYRDWLADPEKSRINRLRTSPWHFAAFLSKAAADNNTPVEVAVLSDIIGRPRVNGGPPVPSNVETIYLADSRHGVPALPAGARVLDAFVCDGPGSVLYNHTAGQWYEELQDGTQVPLTFEDVERRRFYNANGFAGRSTPGLINVNTAPHEVLRTKPHMTRIVHEVQNATFTLDTNPFPEVARALIRYRERLGEPNTAPFAYGTALDAYNINQGPAYGHRGRDRDWFRPGEAAPVPAFLRGMRGDRGLSSIGELKLLTQTGRIGKNIAGPGFYEYAGGASPGQIFAAVDFNSSWRIDYAAMPDRKAFDVDQPPGPNEWTEAYLFGVSPGGANLPPVAPAAVQTSSSARISTDVVEEFDDTPGLGQTAGYFPGLHPDIIAEDAQESNLLFAGISNLVTTRSDVFTVYFRVRSFRQNPITGKWDATDPDYIVDDSRYVMLVDRSNVNKPTDKPKILYLEKLPK